MHRFRFKTTGSVYESYGEDCFEPKTMQMATDRSP
jgi:hypothetical protein